MAKAPTPAIAPAAAAPAAEDPKPEPQIQPEPQDVAEQGTIEARVLVDHDRHRCNTLALLTEAEAANCEGWADTSDEAVAYVKSLGD